MKAKIKYFPKNKLHPKIQEFSEILQQTLSSKLLSIMLRGSWARNDAKPLSDIDIDLLLTEIDTNTFIIIKKAMEILWKPQVKFWLNSEIEYLSTIRKVDHAVRGKVIFGRWPNYIICNADIYLTYKEILNDFAGNIRRNIIKPPSNEDLNSLLRRLLCEFELILCYKHQLIFGIHPQSLKHLMKTNLSDKEKDILKFKTIWPNLSIEQKQRLLNKLNEIVHELLLNDPLYER